MNAEDREDEDGGEAARIERARAIYPWSDARARQDAKPLTTRQAADISAEEMREDDDQAVD